MKYELSTTTLTDENRPANTVEWATKKELRKQHLDRFNRLHNMTTSGGLGVVVVSNEYWHDGHTMAMKASAVTFSVQLIKKGANEMTSICYSWPDGVIDRLSDNELNDVADLVFTRQ